MKAAVMWEREQPLAIEEVQIDGPGPGEVDDDQLARVLLDRLGALSARRDNPAQ